MSAGSGGSIPPTTIQTPAVSSSAASRRIGSAAHHLQRWAKIIEAVYVVGVFVLTMIQLLQVSRGMIQFVLLWGGVAFAAAAVSLWPRSPARLRFVAEAALLVIGVGNWLGPRTNWLPLLNREISDAGFWNHMPVEQRRILAWNLLGSLIFAWFTVGYLFVTENLGGTRGLRLIVKSVIFLFVWGMLGMLFATIAAGMLY